MCAADAAGDVKLFVDYIVPERVARFKELVVIRETCDICHAGIEVYGTNCVSDCFILLPYRKVCLVVCIAQAVRILFYFFRVLLVKIVWTGATFVDEILCELQVFVILCRLIEAYKRHLRDLMSRIALAFAFL